MGFNLRSSYSPRSYCLFDYIFRQIKEQRISSWSSPYRTRYNVCKLMDRCRPVESTTLYCPHFLLWKRSQITWNSFWKSLYNVLLIIRTVCMCASAVKNHCCSLCSFLSHNSWYFHNNWVWPYSWRHSTCALSFCSRNLLAVLSGLWWSSLSTTYTHQPFFPNLLSSTSSIKSA